jgi:hypothetical protein
MKRGYLTRLSKDEWARVDAIVESSSSRKQAVRGLFRNKSVSRSFESGTRSLVHGYEAQVLPSVGLFYDVVLLDVCPSCDCVVKPALLEPFLERNLVVPMLRADYEKYPVEFAETVLRYPHLSSAERFSFRDLRLETGACPHCQEDRKKKVISTARKTLRDPTAIAWIKWLTKGLFDYLQPFGDPEDLLVQELENRIGQRDLTGARRVIPLIDAVEWFRTAEAYSSVPQVSFERAHEIDRLLKQHPELSRPYDIAGVNESILNGLRLSYSPSIPLHTYLDIVLSRRDKIRRIVAGMIQKSKPLSRTFYSNIQAEIENVNEEVRSISSSKRMSLLSFATSFFLDNRSVILGCLSGTALCVKELGPVGCLPGTIMGFAGAKLLSKTPRIVLPSDTEKIKRSLEKAAEPVFERLLSRYLSRTVQSVQVWQLQKRLYSK